MAYKEVYDEYVSLLSESTGIKDVLAGLKRGYISIKKISGRRYAYLQYRNNGRLISEYIKAECLSDVQAELNKRAELEGKQADISERLCKIETAAGILDSDLYRKLNILRRCAEMDTMPVEERRKSLFFGNAIAALEGIPVSAETEHSLLSWANEGNSFYDSFSAVLRTYNLAEVTPDELLIKEHQGDLP